MDGCWNRAHAWLDWTGLVALTRTRLVGGSPLSVIGIKALGDLDRG